ncbi:MAG TPA: FAD-binding oxidoreductase [Pseudonocardiaceae bacterium]
MNTDVVVIGAGIVGAACAQALARAGLSVLVVDRGPIAGGTTGAGEGNLLVSDKELGPELDLALLSHHRWRELAALPIPGADTTLGEYAELEEKGGLVVASDTTTLSILDTLTGQQRAAGVDAEPVPADRLTEYEPHIAAGLAGGYLYPQDMQVQPMRAAAGLLRIARADGARVSLGNAVTGFVRDGDRVIGVRTERDKIGCAAVVNAAGTWAGEIAALAGVTVPVAPRRGFILVTEPLPPLVRHKVYYADYVADVASNSAALQSSTVVEGTRSGTILIGATRERVGFDRSWSDHAIRELARGAVALFPFLAGVSAIRAYRGFRPFCPDHLPVIGLDPRAPGLWHACGHEGAGIGLSAVTGALIAESITGHTSTVDPHPFRPERFEDAA